MLICVRIGQQSVLRHMFSCLEERLPLDASNFLSPILDVNDNDPSFDQDNYLFGVSELSSVGHSIGSIHATDLDVGDAGKYVSNIC